MDAGPVSTATAAARPPRRLHPGGFFFCPSLSLTQREEPATQDKIRTALAAEPGLTKGTWIDDLLLDYLRQAVAAQSESGQD